MRKNKQGTIDEKQYAVLKYLYEYGFTQSMSRASQCLDTQPIECFFGLIKAEYYYRKQFNTLNTGTRN
ncbi:hypothetical protein [Carnobacterium sp.]|uniref:hypothetical protein n=1 Tax=Carnobacterium sp. TaxID=48221 RepID=UPI00388D4A19